MEITDRQNKIIDLLCNGKKIIEISEIFNCSKSTIEKELFWFKEFYQAETLIKAIYLHFNK